ncbi:hypothetical protein HDU83_003951 [Entophlyctis luteolus]|nr:hypothetical protein HDU83_003951 [Entophlyctis luteolus]
MKGLSPSSKLSAASGADLTVLIVHTRWNTAVVDALTIGTIAQLRALGVLDKNITVLDVPGAFELPFAAKSLIAKKKYDAVIAIGVLIKGDTMHFEYIADATTQGLMRVGLDSGVPVVFGVLTCMNEEQALLRAGIGGSDGRSGHNHGTHWGSAAVEMALLNKLA